MAFGVNRKRLERGEPHDRLRHGEVPGKEIEHKRDRENREDKTGQDKLIRKRGVPSVALDLDGYRRDGRSSALQKHD